MANELNYNYARELQQTVKTWLGGGEDIPAELTFENLPENDYGICFTTTQAPLYAAKYITGGYKGQYQFQIIYRVLPSDDDDMIDAVDLLMRYASWCADNPPAIDGAVNTHVERTSNAAIVTAYEDGTSDYAISLTLTWEEF